MYTPGFAGIAFRRSSNFAFGVAPIAGIFYRGRLDGRVDAFVYLTLVANASPGAAALGVESTVRSADRDRHSARVCGPVRIRGGRHTVKPPQPDPGTPLGRIGVLPQAGSDLLVYQPGAGAKRVCRTC